MAAIGISLHKGICVRWRKHRWVNLSLMKNCCHRRDGWNGKSNVYDLLSVFNFSSNGIRIVSIGIEKAFSSPPFGLGNVIFVSRKSTQGRGTRVSRSRQPVWRPISNDTCIHSGSAFNASLILMISSSVNSGFFSACRVSISGSPRGLRPHSRVEQLHP